MKTRFLFILLLFCWLCSCSDKEILNPQEKYQTNSLSIPGLTGPCISIRIKGIDDGNSSRATEIVTGQESSYAPGSEKDYRVIGGHILLFRLSKGTTLTAESENEAEFECVIPLIIQSNEFNNTNPEISSDVILYGRPSTKDFNCTDFDYYAVIVLNPSVNFPNPGPSEKFGDWKWSKVEEMWTTDIKGNYYITMTNAPEWQPDGDPVTLQKIDMTKVYDIESEEEPEEAGTFYLQRGVAKITVYAPNFWDNANQPTSISEGVNAGDIVVFYGFTAENVNTASYPVQITEGLSTDFSDIWKTSRFYDASSSTFKRVLWSRDVNYFENEQKGFETFKDHTNLLKKLDELPHVVPFGGEVLVHENTMVVDCQNNLNSTRVLDRAVYLPFRLLLGDYENFEGSYEEYLAKMGFDQDPAFNNELLTPEQRNKLVPQGQKDNPEINPYAEDESYFNQDRREWMLRKSGHYAVTLKGRKVEQDYDEDGTNDNYDVVTQRSLIMTADQEGKWFRYQFVDLATQAYCELTKNSSSENYEVIRESFNSASSTLLSGYYTLRELLPQDVNNNEVRNNQEYIRILLEKLGEESIDTPITYYKNSIMYYSFIVRHFLDSEGVAWQGGNSYDGDNERYLGRWGTVRNNWYYVTIAKVTHPGEPNVPEIEDRINDSPKAQYLDVNISVNSWHKQDISVFF